MADPLSALTDEQTALIRHWTGYGQRGRTPGHRVRPWEWNAKPFVSPVTTPWHVAVEPDQLALLLLGFVPMKHHGVMPPLHIVVEGETLMTHILMSTSANKDVSASEDKWFVYADGPNHAGEVRVHMHRSWTGIKQIELVIDAGYEGRGKAGGGAAITTIVWENEEDKKWKDANADTYKTVAREVCNWVLNVKLGPEA